MRNWNSKGLFALIIVLGPMLSGCEESLPVRNEPEGVVQPRVWFYDGLITVSGGVLVGFNGAFEARLRNTYAEVLQGESHIHGTLEIWLRDRPEKRATLTITQSDLQNISILDRTTVTLEPGAEARFARQWNHQTDEGEWFWELVDTTQLVTPDSIPYADSDSVNVVSRVRLQLFKNVPAQQSQPSEQTFLYRIY